MITTATEIGLMVLAAFFGTWLLKEERWAGDWLRWQKWPGGGDVLPAVDREIQARYSDLDYGAIDRLTDEEYRDRLAEREAEYRARAVRTRPIFGSMLECWFCTGFWVSAIVWTLWGLQHRVNPIDLHFLVLIPASAAVIGFLGLHYDRLVGDRGW